MKNTAKKILALVFAVAMICTMAVPAFAAEKEVLDGVDVYLISLAKNATRGYYYSGYQHPNFGDVEEGDTLHDVLKAVDAVTTVDLTYSATKGVSRDMQKDNLEADGAKGKWVVAVNGVVVDAYKDYVMAEDDQVVIYWADSVADTKVILADYEQILSGVVSYYYLDAEGNRQPVEDMTFRIRSHRDDNGTYYLTDRLSDNATEYFVTDEAGQIWIAPQDLSTITELNFGRLMYSFNYFNVAPNAVYDVAPSSDDYDEDVAEYYATFGELSYVPFATMLSSDVLLKADSYDAPNTGDMTMVYVLVAAAAIVTLGAVVVMKKKAVKAN